ncbi:MAG: Ig-like domain-containing protein [Anaerovoracaceae bacterium]
MTKKSGQRLIAILLTLLMVFTMIPASAFAGTNQGTIYNNGTYTGSASDIGGSINAEVTLVNDIITELKITHGPHGEQDTDSKNAWEKVQNLIENIKNASNTEVDGISGATSSSNGIKTAVNEALDKALINKTISNVPDDFANDIWLNAEFKELKTGESYDINARRVPEMITDAIANDVSHPEYTYELIEGDSVTLDGKKVTAVKAGKSVIKVGYKEAEYKGLHFPAISAINYAYFIVDVNNDPANVEIKTDLYQIKVNSSNPDAGMNEQASDIETKGTVYDTYYFTKEQGSYPFEFEVKAEGADSIEVTNNGTVLTGNNDKYIANLVSKSNVIGVKVTKDGKTKSQYWNIDARELETEIKNKTNPGSSVYRAGETIEISFKGMVSPVYKLATIYNPQFGKSGTTARYTASYNDEPGKEVVSAGTQWEISKKEYNKITINIPTEKTGTLKLTGGYMNVGWWGSVIDSHRDQIAPGTPNLNASTHHGVFGSLPDISIDIAKEILADKVSLDKTSATLNYKDTLQLNATIAPEDATVKDVIWSSSNPEAVKVDEKGLVTALKANSKATITAKSKSGSGVSGTCEVTINPIKVDTVINLINKLPQLEKMNYGTIYDIDEAREFYNLLTNAEKAKVTNYAVLEKAEAHKSELEKLLPFEIITNTGEKIELKKTGESDFGDEIFTAYVSTDVESVKAKLYKQIKIEDDSNFKPIASGNRTTVDIPSDKRLAFNYDSGTYKIVEFVRYFILDIKESTAMINNSSIYKSANELKNSLKDEDKKTSGYDEFINALKSVDDLKSKENKSYVIDNALRQLEKTSELLNDNVNGFKYEISQKKAEGGTEVTVTFPNLKVDNILSEDTKNAYLQYTSDIQGQETIKGSEAKDDKNLLKEITFVTNKYGKVKLSGGLVYRKNETFIHPQFPVQVEEKKYYEGKLPNIEIDVKDMSSSVAPPAIDEKISITFEFTGDVVHKGNPGGHTDPTWVRKSVIEVKKGSTVKDVTDAILAEKGIETEITFNGTYIAKVKSPHTGDWLGEFTNGPNSGWMYRHNGLIADEGYAERVLKDGDSVKWFYTDDYTKETGYEGGWDNDIKPSDPTTPETRPEGDKIISTVETGTKTDENGKAEATVSDKDLSNALDKVIEAIKDKDNVKGEIVLDIKTDNKATDISAKLPSNTIKELAKQKKVDLVLETGLGKIKLDNDAVKKIAGEAKGTDVSISVAKAETKNLTPSQKKQLDKIANGRPALELKVVSDGKNISDFGGGKATITVPYTLKKGEVADGIRLFYIDAKGKVTQMIAKYDAKNKTITASTNHFSLYAVGYRDVPTKVRVLKTFAKKNAASLKWSRATNNPDGYRIYKATSKNGKYTPVAWVKNGKAKTYTNKKLKTGKTYYYKVRAFKKINSKLEWGKFSPVKSVKVK